MSKKSTDSKKSPVKKASKVKKTVEPKKPNIFLSVSRINLFEQCPQKYYYRYLEKLPDIPSYHSAAGSFLHKALELFVYEFIKTKDVRTSAQKAYIASKQDPEIAALGELITPELCDEVKAWIRTYAKQLEAAPEKAPDFLKAETPFRFKIANSNIIVNGFIDRIDRLSDTTVQVVDYKTTGKPEYLDPFQLVVYTIPVQKMFPGKKIEASYELARMNFEKRSYEVTDEDRQKAMDKFVSIGAQIETLIAANNPKAWVAKPSFLCNYCPYKMRCTKDNQSSW